MRRTVLIVMTLLLSACTVEKLSPQKAESTGYCGRSTLGACTSDAECRITGCSGQVCQSVKEEPAITTCEWRECYDAKKFGVQCSCLNEQCQWK